jgi:hypothetical protein
MARNAYPMDFLAFRLGEMLDRPVVNLTQLKGSYDFDFSFTIALPPGAAEHPFVNGVAVDTSGPRIFEAIHKLGLRLESKKHPIEIMVIDHAEKPVGIRLRQTGALPKARLTRDLFGQTDNTTSSGNARWASDRFGCRASPALPDWLACPAALICA